ncbi:MAG: tetratricopeptide repeat protein [Thiobacillaceae bacterium]
MAKQAQGDFDGAVADFDKAAELNPTLGRRKQP